MRESIGGGMLMYALIPLFVALIIFVASIMQYANTYRIVNKCVTSIEASESCSSGCSDVITEVVPVDSEKCKVRVKKNVEFEIPFAGKATLYTVTAETKSMTN